MIAGYREAGGRLDGSFHIRLALYRAYLGLIMLTECAPRGYEADRVAWCRDRLDGFLADLSEASR